MIATYSEAHRRVNRILELFSVGCTAGFLIGVALHGWWFATVWAAAGLLAVVIETSKRQSAIMAGVSANIATTELADERAFEGKFLKFPCLLAATILAAGFELGNPWWSSLLAATIAWFTSMFVVALLCAPRINAEREVGDD
jgi:hypothetical protein